MLQGYLAAYGAAVGRRPFLAAGLGLAVCCGLCLGWLEVLRRDPVQKTEDLEELWSVRGGQVAQEIRWVKELRDDEPWDKKLVMTFFVGKGARRDQDMLRPEVLAELLPLFGRPQGPGHAPARGAGGAPAALR